MSVFVAALAFIVERWFGYPPSVQKVIGHPVEWIGRLIGLLDARLNRDTDFADERRRAGIVTLLVVLAATGAVAVLAQWVCDSVPFGFLFEALMASSLIASRHLGQAVASVATGLDRSLEAGQDALQPIVGRDARSLDEHGVARAAIETLAENTSDGVVAPLLFLALFGLPGIALYKAINTADSMLGHLTERHRDFGWASARLDDVVNFVPARLTALLIAGAAFFKGEDMQGAWETAPRDAPLQDSPNSGWPEAAMAGALGLRLGGPRAYQGEMADLPFMGRGRLAATADDIRRALGVYGRVNDLSLVGFVVLALLLAGAGFY